MALSAVLLPAPFGPISPRMRPRSTDRSMPSSATVFPKTFRKPLASMQAIVSTLPFVFLAGAVGLRCGEQVLRRQPQPLNGLADRRPFLLQEFAALGFEQQVAHIVFD